MKVQYRHGRLEMISENHEEKMFVNSLIRLVQSVSNDLMAWYGDVKFDSKETSGCVITNKTDKNSELKV
jgi:hypothetical protein